VEKITLHKQTKSSFKLTCRYAATRIYRNKKNRTTTV